MTDQALAELQRQIQEQADLLAAQHAAERALADQLRQQQEAAQGGAQ
ncbi:MULTISPECIES: hypothetical protein [Streptomycetaceae]|nr:hypothetical protein [Streptomyces sp. CB02056]